MPARASNMGKTSESRAFVPIAVPFLDPLGRGRNLFPGFPTPHNGWRILGDTPKRSGRAEASGGRISRVFRPFSPCDGPDAPSKRWKDPGQGGEDIPDGGPRPGRDRMGLIPIAAAADTKGGRVRIVGVARVARGWLEHGHNAEGDADAGRRRGRGLAASGPGTSAGQ